MFGNQLGDVRYPWVINEKKMGRIGIVWDTMGNILGYLDKREN